MKNGSTFLAESIYLGYAHADYAFIGTNTLYVKSVSLNGKPLDGYILRHADIIHGGTLVFEMSSSR